MPPHPCSCETCLGVVNCLEMAKTEATMGADNTISLGVAVALSNTYDPACRLPLNYWLPKDYSLAPRN